MDKKVSAVAAMLHEQQQIFAMAAGIFRHIFQLRQLHEGAQSHRPAEGWFSIGIGSESCCFSFVDKGKWRAYNNFDWKDSEKSENEEKTDEYRYF